MQLSSSIHLMYTRVICRYLVPIVLGWSGLAHASWEFDKHPDYNDPSQFELDVSQTVSLDLPFGTEPVSIVSPENSLSGNEADSIAPEIENLAASLENDPARIFEFVFNGIDYEHYFGSKRGARLTLLEGAGNDTDQVSLLVALFRAAGLQAGYITIWNTVYYDQGSPFFPDAITWLGLATNPLPGITFSSGQIPAGWTELQLKKTLVLRDFCQARGFVTYTFSNLPGGVLIQRTIATVQINGTVYALDPSAKAKTLPSPVNIATATGFNKSAFLSAIGGTTTNHYVQGINESTLRQKLADYTETLISNIRSSHSAATVESLLGTGSIRPIVQTQIGSGITPLGWVSNTNFPLQSFATISTSMMSRLELQINTTAVHTVFMPEMSGNRLAITHTGNTVNIWLEDSVLFSRTVTGATYQLKMRAKHPHFMTGTSIPRNDGEFTAVYKKSGHYALIYSFSPTRRLIRHRQEKLDGYIEAIRAIDEDLVGADGNVNLVNLTDATLRRQIITELLNLMGQNWLYQTEFASRTCASMNDMNVIRHHCFGRIGQEESYYVDVGLWRAGNFRRNGLDIGAKFLVSLSYLFSALEHGVIDQYAFNTNSAVSTVQIFHLANSSTNSAKNRIYYADSTTWSAVQTQLNGYVSADLTNFAAKVNSGSILLLPRHKNNGATGWTWNGSGYMEIAGTSNGVTVGMIITGDYNTSGGYSTHSATINAPPVIASSRTTPNYYNYGGSSSITLASTPTWNTPSFYGSDPVDMATGAFVYDQTDLELGGAGPRGLRFARHYSSARRQTDKPGLGFGWTHNYDMRAFIRTAPEAGLGETTTYEASAMLAAAAVINELLDGSIGVKEMTTAALVAKHAVDNLLNNAISITMGKDTIQFIRQPNGDYTAPAASTMSLERNDNEIRLSERLGNTWTFDLSNGGRVTTTEDFFGNTQNFAYDGSGNLQTVTDADDRELTFTWSGGRITEVADGTGRSVSFEYDEGNLIETTDPENMTTIFAYDDNHRLEEIRDPENRVIIFNEYDSNGRIFAQEADGDPEKRWTLFFSGLRNIEVNPLGGRNTYGYDKRARPLFTEDGVGNRTIMQYDGHDHMTVRRTPGGREVRSVFDPHHRLRVQSDAATGVVQTILVDTNFSYLGVVLASGTNHRGTVTSYQYDALHRPVAITTRVLSGAFSNRTTGFEYDSGNTSGNPNKVIDPRGKETLFTYYTDGLLHTETRVSSNGNLTTTWEYDDRGMPEAITYPDASTEHFLYNERGDLIAHTDRNGHTTTNLYNHRRQLVQRIAPDNGVTSYTYSDSGNLETVTDPQSNVTRHIWSAQRKPVRIITAYGTPQAATNSYEYDEREWKVRSIDPLARVTHFEYDHAQRMVAMIDPLAREALFDYDADGNLIRQVSPLGFTNSYVYNMRKERIAMTDPLGGTVVYVRNNFGEQIALTNRRHQTYGFTYDQGGNPLTLTTPLSHTSAKVWDDLNQIARTVTPSGKTNSFAYDAMGRVESRSDAVGTVGFTYDDNGNPLAITEGTNVLTRTFDAMNRVISYTDANGNVIGYRWDKNGNVTNVVYPGNRVVSYSYDGNNRLQAVTDWTNRVTTYHWDVAGRLVGIMRPNGVNRLNQYTDGDELERYYERRASDTILLAYGRFGYDDDSRPLFRYRLPQPQTAVETPFDAVYDADNRIAQWNAQTVTHDDDGNMIFGPLPGSGMTSYVYDARNRLVDVGGVDYVYDAENNRVSMTTTNGTTRYIIDPHGDALPRVLVRKRPDDSLTYYVYGIGLLYEVDENDEASYYHFDQIGSTVAMTDEAGQVTDRVEYSAYGTITHREGTNDTPFLYVGQLGVQADENGLLYMRARYYSPETRRFVNADPIGFLGGLNWYSYANNSPLLYVDPNGKLSSSTSQNSISQVSGGDFATSTYQPPSIGPYTYTSSSQPGSFYEQGNDAGMLARNTMLIGSNIRADTYIGSQMATVNSIPYAAAGGAALVVATPATYTYAGQYISSTALSLGETYVVSAGSAGFLYGFSTPPDPSPISGNPVTTPIEIGSQIGGAVRIYLDGGP